jgi:CDP-diacylglycerol--serine O-phosphatidyltransferase
MDDGLTKVDANTANGASRKRRFTRVPLRYVLPNLVTLLGLCLGLTAIRYAIEARFDLAVYAIAGAAVLDGLDGRLARALDSTSRFGAELDSLADFIDFGVAPAMILYMWSLNDIKSAGWFAAMVYAIACALRLARFNVAIDDPNKPSWAARFFVGMPSPAGAIVVLLPIYLTHSFFGLPQSRPMTILIIAYTLLIAFLMVSRLPHWSGKEMGRVPREYFIVVLFGVAVAILLLYSFPMEVLASLSILYLVHLPFAYRRYKALERQDADNRPVEAEGS